MNLPIKVSTCFYVLVILLMSTGTAFSQKIISLATPPSGGYKPINEACQEVRMLSGFSFKASSTQSFIARVDATKICENNYKDAPDPNNPIPPYVINKSLPLGAIAGNSTISSSGGASYQIPITIPPGTAGMQPNLSLVYNSQGGNGLLGMGWNLAGLSAITRRGQTIYMDGKVTGVELNDNDKFALDGNRLVPAYSDPVGPPMVGGETQAGDEIYEYRTEMETFNRVISAGQPGAGPRTFVVTTKSGMVMKYGFTEDSRIEAQGKSVVLMWLLNEIRDQSGNYIRFKYNEDPNSHEYHIDKIEYTGNATAGKDPYIIIQFHYDGRNDKSLNYVAGSAVSQSVLLSKITIAAAPGTTQTTPGNNTTQGHQYQFNYYKQLYSHLNEIIEYGYDGKQLNSTRIDWGALTNRIVESDDISDLGVIDPHSSTISGDFNGDGNSDLLSGPFDSDCGRGKWNILLNNMNGESFSPTWSGNIDTGYIYKQDEEDKETYAPSGINVFDFNGDGKDELLLVNRLKNTNGNQFAYQRYDYSPATNTFVPGTSLLARDNYVAQLVGDFDGDGSSELFTLYNDPGQNNWKIRRFDNTAGDVGTDINEWGYDSALPIDFNGNGKTDIMLTRSTYGNKVGIFEYAGNGQMIKLYGTNNDDFTDNNHIGNAQYKYFGDFNGDGKTDILVYRYGWKILYSDGKSFIPLNINFFKADEDPNYNLNMLNGDFNYFIQDFNGDGKSDILEIYSHSSLPTYQSIIHYSTGAGFISGPVVNLGDDIMPKENYFTFGDFNGDGRADAFYYDEENSSKNFIIQFEPNGNELLVKNITNGLGNKISYKYHSINNVIDPVYTKTLATSNFKGPLNLVSEVTLNDGIGGQVTIDYKYEDGRVDLKGRGFLGFKKVITETPVHDIAQSSTYEINETYLFPSLLKSETYLVSNQSKKISEVNYTNSVKVMDANTKRIFPYVSQSSSKDLLKDITTTTSSVYNPDGNLESSSTNHSGEGTTLVTNESFDTQGSWMPYQPKKVTVTQTRTGKPAYTRVSEFTYTTKGKVETQIIDPGAAQVKNTYHYDSYGNNIWTLLESPGLPAAINLLTFDNNGRFPLIATNQLGHSNSNTYDFYTGLPLTQTDVNQLVTSYSYDGFGRVLKTVLPTKQELTTTYEWATDNSIPGSLYKITTTSPGTPGSITYFDILNRNIRSQTKGFDGSPINVQTNYNNRTEVIGTSLPFFTGGSIVWNNNSYDEYGRLKQQSGPTATIGYSYSGKTTTVTNNSVNPNQQSYSTINAFGGIAKTGDAGGENIFTYFSNGKPESVTQGGTGPGMKYDNYGRQTELNDPNAGLSTYVYNAYGQLKKQDGPKANDTYNNITYDALGRITSKPGPEGTTSYTYDTQPKGTGLPATVTAPDGSTITYEYDEYSRLKKETKVINAKSFITQYFYDQNSNLSQIIYPSGLILNRVYNVYGYLNEIWVSMSQKRQSIWKCSKMNASLQVTESFASNNNIKKTTGYTTTGLLDYINAGTVFNWDYQFDPATGNLTYRQDVNRPGLKESFTYDNLNRLKAITKEGAGALSIDYTANKNGNIAHKWDAGGPYQYTDIPHAVSQIDNPDLTTIPLQQQDITYTSFNKISEIKEGSYRTSFSYGANEERTIMTSFQTDPASSVELKKNTCYYAGAYQKDEQTATSRELHYISSPEGLCAIIARSATLDTIYYTYTDHLGSIMVLANDAGVKQEERSFDAWGRMRNPNDWSYTNVPAMKLSRRGYTGHEHLPQFGLINMNGRFYDPVVGRMLSADNFVQDPSSTQSFNRYSYCWNNPLKYTDPSGWYIYGQRQSLPPSFGELMLTFSEVGSFSIGDRTYMIDGMTVSASMFRLYSENGALLENATIERPGEYTFYKTPDGQMHANEGAAAGHMGATYDRETGNYEKLEMTSNNFYRNAALGLNSTGNFNGNAVTYEFVPIKINRNTGESNDWNTAGNAAFWSQQGLGAVNYAAKSAAASTPQYGYRGMAQAEASSAKVLGGVAKTTRVLGVGASFVGTFASGAQFYYSDRSGADYARLVGAGLITGANFIPLAGPFISIGLGALDTYGAFDSFYNSFDSPLNINKQ